MLFKEFSFITVIIGFLRLYINFAFLTSGLSLIHKSIEYSKNVFLRIFVSDGIALKFLPDVDLKG